MASERPVVVTSLGPQRVDDGRPGRHMDDVLSPDDVAHSSLPHPSSDIPHGTLSGYQWHGCRCPDCRGANSERVRNIRARHRAERIAEQQNTKKDDKGSTK